MTLRYDFGLSAAVNIAINADGLSITIKRDVFHSLSDCITAQEVICLLH